MSIKHILAAMEAKVGSSARKLVLIKLADNANDNGECYPSYLNIADHCEMSKRSIISHVAKLETDGFLTKEIRKRGVNNTSNLYRLTIKSGSAELAPPSAELAPPSAEFAPPPSANSAPLISHSFKPVTEPVTEPKDSVKNEDAIFNETDIFNLFNSFFSELPKAIKLNTTRTKRIKKLIAVDLPTIEAWNEFFNVINKSDFLMGRTKNDFQCSFDWILTPANAIKIAEGNYKNKQGLNNEPEFNSDEYWQEIAAG